VSTAGWIAELTSQTGRDELARHKRASVKCLQIRWTRCVKISVADFERGLANISSTISAVKLDTDP
jgi:hypothetical protein